MTFQCSHSACRTENRCDAWDVQRRPHLHPQPGIWPAYLSVHRTATTITAASTLGMRRQRDAWDVQRRSHLHPQPGIWSAFLSVYRRRSAERVCD